MKLRRSRTHHLVVCVATLVLSSLCGAAERSPVRISELRPLNAGARETAHDWVELVNDSASAFSVAGWELENRAGDVYVFPPDLPAVPARAFVVVRFDGRGPRADDYDVSDGVAELHAELHLAGMLGKRDQLALYEPLGQNEPRVLRDFVAWGAPPGSRASEAREAGLWHPYWRVSLHQGTGVLVDGESPRPDLSIGILPGRPGVSPDDWMIYSGDDASPGRANPLPAPAWSTLEEGAVLATDAWSFGWESVPGALYEIEFDETGSFTDPILGLTLDAPSLTGPDDAPPGSFWWHVRAFTPEGDASDWSSPRRLTLAAPPGVRKGRQTSRTLNVPWLRQRKDTALLCIDGDREGRPRDPSPKETWDAEHPDQILVHGRNNCVRAAIAMIAGFFGGQLSQDRLSYEYLERGGQPIERSARAARDPQLDLGHDEPTWICGLVGAEGRQLFAWALGLAASTDIQYVRDKPALSAIRGWIDGGRPIIRTFPNGAIDHAVVIAGYRNASSQGTAELLVLDPWSGPYWQSYDSMSFSCVYVAPASAPNVRSDEPGISQDTDGDGIMDWDEQVRFGTSPTARDTDADGVPDREDLREYVFDNFGNYLLRDPDRDRDGLRKELDPDNDADGALDGCEDANWNGVFEPPVESSNFVAASTPSDPHEPNNSTRTASPLGAGTTRARIDAGDLDYWILDLDRISHLYLDLRVVDQWSENGLVIEFDGKPGVVVEPGLTRFARDFLDVGRHELIVRGLKPGSVNCYVIDLSLTPAAIPHWFLALEDPPLIRYLVPAVDRILATYPSDPVLVDRILGGNPPASLPPEYVLVSLREHGDLEVELNTVDGGFLAFSLLDPEGSSLGTSAAGVDWEEHGAVAPPGGEARRGHLLARDLAPGDYTIEVGPGDPLVSYSLGAAPSAIRVLFESDPLPSAAPNLSGNTPEIVALVEDGSSAQVDVFVKLSAYLPLQGIQAWSLGIGFEGEARLVSASLDGTDLDLHGGVEVREIVDPARNGGLQGAISAALLGLDHLATLPPAGAWPVLRLTVEAALEGGEDEKLARLFLADGLVGSGEPVENVVTVHHQSYRPANLESAGVVVRFVRQKPVVDLVLEAIELDRARAQLGEVVRAVAIVRNDGAAAADGVEVAFVLRGETVATGRVDRIEAGDWEIVETSFTASEEGTLALEGVVNAARRIAEANFENNSAAADVEVVLETNPGWRKPDIELSDLTWEPMRPLAGQSVLLRARVANTRREPVEGSTVITLSIDGEFVTRTGVEDLDRGSRDIELLWPVATAGRHNVDLEARHLGPLEEISLSNNRLSALLRVGGGNPLPDVVVDDFEWTPPVREDADGNFRARIANPGFAAAANLEYRVLVDGRFHASGVIGQLGPEGVFDVNLPISGLPPGIHVVTIEIDPENAPLDTSVQTRWSQEIHVPGPRLRRFARSNEWESIGPRPIQHRAEYIPGPEHLEIDTGLVGSIDISRQSPNVLVIGTSSGGIWKSEDRGAHWRPIADDLPSPDFRFVVRFDPRDHDIIYGANSDGLYKTLDGGLTWRLFADRTEGRQDYAELIVRYAHPTQPERVTIDAATRSGVWRFEGDRRAPTTALGDWRHLWWRPGGQSSGDDSQSRVRSMVLTAEATPRLVIAADEKRNENTIEAPAAIFAAPAGNPAAWTDITSGLPDGRLWITLGSSPARPERVFAAAVVSGTDCDPHPEQTTYHTGIYRRDAGESQWTFIAYASDRANICGSDYNEFIAVDPANANRLYHAGVKFWRSGDGGATWSDNLTGVHDDSKDYRFDPHEPSRLYLTSDGGIYVCDGAGPTDCRSLNQDLAITQFYDIALSASSPGLIIGGTQDNGTLRYDAPTLAWREIRGGDGKYCAIDPVDPDNMYSQHQYFNQTERNVGGGLRPGGLVGRWDAARFLGLPNPKFVGNIDGFLAIHPQRPGTLLMAVREVYRTLDGGDNWASLGPFLEIGPGRSDAVHRLAIDGRSDRYYAGTWYGRLHVTRHEGAAESWVRAYIHPHDNWIATIVPDPETPETVYLTFGNPAPPVIVRLRHTGNWPGTWSAEDLTGNFPTGAVREPRSLGATGRYSTGVRGLVKHPGLERIYVGTDRGIYQGNRTEDGWEWCPDNCGFPRTWVSDLEMHPSGAFMVAATFGRGAYRREIAVSDILPDAYELPARNDGFDAITDLGAVRPRSLVAEKVVEGLTLDRLSDQDFFRFRLEPEVGPECLAPGGPDASFHGYTPGYVAIAVGSELEVPEPFHIGVYRRAGNEYALVREVAERSYLGWRLECPHATFPDGEIIFSVRALQGCVSRYSLRISYDQARIRRDAPALDFDPPERRLLPEASALEWTFPADPARIDRGFHDVAQADEEAAPTQSAFFPWDRAGDLEIAVFVLGHGRVEATLATLEGRDLGTLSATGAVAGRGAGAQIGDREPSARLAVPDLPSGWYELRFHDGAFATQFTTEFRRGGEGEEALFLRGDCNGDGSIDVSDAITTLRAVFGGGPAPFCGDACDTNDDGSLDVSDASATLRLLFLGEGSLPPPSAECGGDPTEDAVGCDSHGACG